MAFIASNVFRADESYMSIWVELRCDDSGEPHSYPIYTGNNGLNGLETSECWSHDNGGCGQISFGSSQKLFWKFTAKLQRMPKAQDG